MTIDPTALNANGPLNCNGVLQFRISIPSKTNICTCKKRRKNDFGALPQSKIVSMLFTLFVGLVAWMIMDRGVSLELSLTMVL
jgi:hypothetical protein